MIRRLARHTVLAAALASLPLAARADISEGRYSPYDAEVYAPVAPSAVRILDREPASLDFEAVGTVEAIGKDEPEVEILEQLNGLRPPAPLAFFSTAAVRNEDDAGLALHALKMVAARYGVQALYIIESGRAQIRNNVVGHRIVAKAFRRKANNKAVSAPRQN